MGIYDREYYRDATRGSGWLTGAAPVCKALIGTNIVCFIIVLFQRDALAYLDLTSESVLRGGQVWRLVTTQFMHVDGWHLAVNMVVLWFFGRDMEALYGPRDFLAMYLTGGVVGSLAYVMMNAWMGNPNTPVIGASGAVYGVVILYTLYYPSREVLLFFILPVPMWLLAVFYVGQDLLGLVRQAQGGPTSAVAFAAHLGGAAYGALFRLYDLRWSRLGKLARPRPASLRLVRPESFDADREFPKPVSGGPAKSVTASGASRPSPALLQAQAEEYLEARVDEILAKIARDGRSSLSDEEHRVLQEASRRAQAKRSDRP